MPINSFLYPAPSTPTFAYNVANSLRFERSSSDYLSKTFGSGGNRKTATQSFWMKRSLLSTNMMAGLTTTASGSYYGIQIMTDDVLDIYLYYSGSAWEGRLKTNRVFRDTNAWYHFVLAWDTTQSTASNRFKLYVNGVQETSFQVETYPNQNQDLDWNNNIAHQIMSGGGGTFSGYLAEFVFIDGQALDPTSFGEFDSDSPNIWKPIDVSGLTFGTNGFYLDFENASSLGADVSGNSNNFTVNNLTSIDQTTDTCTNNFATLNSLSSRSNNGTFSEGNTKFVGTMDGDWTVGTIAATAGKWYWEVKANEANYLMLGITTTDIINDNPTGSLSGDGFMGFRNTDNFYNFGTLVTNSYSYSDNDIFSFMLDLDAGDCEFYQNDTLKQTITLPTDKGDTWIPIIGDTYDVTDGNYNINFGNPSVAISSGNTDPNGYGNFEYATKSGYAWNTKNLAEFG